MHFVAGMVRELLIRYYDRVVASPKLTFLPDGRMLRVLRWRHWCFGDGTNFDTSPRRCRHVLRIRLWYLFSRGLDGAGGANRSAVFEA